MSWFILGYAKGKKDGGGGSDRIEKIDKADTIVKFPLPNGWSIRFKIVFDLAEMSYGVFNDPEKSEYAALNTYIYPAFFMCAYKNDKFVYAVNEKYLTFNYKTYNTVLAGDKDVLYLQIDQDTGVLPDPDDETSFIPNVINISSVSMGKNDPFMDIGYSTTTRVRKYDAYGKLTEIQFIENPKTNYNCYMLSEISAVNDQYNISDMLVDFYTAYKLYSGG